MFFFRRHFISLPRHNKLLDFKTNPRPEWLSQQREHPFAQNKSFPELREHMRLTVLHYFISNILT